MNPRHRSLTLVRSLVIAACLLAADQSIAQITQQRILSSPPAGTAERCGQGMAPLGDINGDGIDDVAMGCPFAALGIGRVAALSGATGGTLWSVVGPAAARQFGHSLTRIDDVNGDGIADLGVGAPQTDVPFTNSGAAYILSGANGSVLRTFNWNTSQDRFGYSVAAMRYPSLAAPLLIVGIPYRGTDNGGFEIYNALTGAIFFSYQAPTANGLAGWSVANAGDFTGDGIPDVIVGAPNASNASGGVGEARIISIAPGTTMEHVAINGGTTATSFGIAVDGGGNVNGDEFADVVIGAPSYSGTSTNAGRVRVFTGPLGEARPSITGSAGSLTGLAVAFVGDVDGDGADDFAYGAPASSDPAAPVGRVSVRSGRTNSTLGSVLDTYATAGFGLSLAKAGDTNRDGHPDILLANPYQDIVWIIGANSQNIGSREDLVLRTSIAGTDFRTWPEMRDVATSGGGVDIGIQLLSPNGTYDGAIPMIFGWVRLSAAPNPVVGGFPEVHLDPSTAFSLYDPYQFGIFGPTTLSSFGLSLFAHSPAGIDGITLVIQGAVLAPAPYLGNATFTATNAHELRFVPGGAMATLE